MEKLRFCIVGTNTISHRFAEAALQCPDVCLQGVYSRASETGQAFARRHGVLQVYTDMKEMLSDPSVDAVYIATPNFCHFPMAKAALEAGKHVLCEKPMTETAEQTETLICLSKRVGKVLLEAMRPDFDPAYDVLRQALPRIGAIRQAGLSFCQYSSRYDAFRRGEILSAFDPSVGNCALADIGIYPLHIAVSLFGEPSSIDGASVFLSNGFEGAGQAILSYENSHIVNICYSKITDGRLPSFIEGEEGTLTIDKLTQPRRIVYTSAKGEGSVLFDAEIPNNMVYEIQAFCSMTAGQVSALPYLAKTHATMRIYDRLVAQNGIFD